MTIDISDVVINICKSTGDWSVVDIVTVLISVIALIISIWQWFSNNKISVKNEFIKNEAKVLLEFREKYIKAQSALLWFRFNLLTTFIYEHRTEPPTISLKKMQYNYNLLNELNEIYILNQHILLKHNLYDECTALSQFLQTFEGYNYQDFTSSKIKEKKGKTEYKLDCYDRIVKDFTINLSKVYEKEPLKDSDIDKNYKLFEKYKNKFFEQLSNLEFKLDKETLYSSIKNDKKSRREKHFHPYYDVDYKEDLSKNSDYIVNIDN